MSVPPADGGVGVAFGVTVGTADINYVDGQLQSYLAKFPQITASSVVIFEMSDTHLTDSGNCCVGGYHSALGSQTYAQFTYIGTSGAFAEDVSALSHELGEWADDPFANNKSPCGILEVGDPLENTANYGAYPYTLGGFTYQPAGSGVHAVFWGATDDVAGQPLHISGNVIQCLPERPVR